LDFGTAETINKKSSVIPTQVSLFVSRRTQINDRQEALQSDFGMFKICEPNLKFLVTLFKLSFSKIKHFKYNKISRLKQLIPQRVER